MPVTVLDEPFRQGIAPDKRVAANSQFLTRAYGAKVSEFGCVNFETLTPASAKTSEPWTDAWPFPQIFRMEADTLVLGRNKLYKWSPEGLTQVPIFNKHTNGVQIVQDPGLDIVSGIWTLVNCFKVSGEGKVRKTSSSSGHMYQPITTISNRPYVVTVVISAVMAEGKIRVTLGNVNSEWVDAQPGTYRFEIWPSGGGLYLRMDANVKLDVDFVGCQAIEPIPDLNLPTSSRPFHGASFREVFILTNGSVTILCSSSNGVSPGSPLRWRTVMWKNADDGNQPCTKMGCVENLNNRLYIGGFNPEDNQFDSDDWNRIWETWVQFHTTEATYEGLAINHGTVFYSRSNTGDYWWPLATEMAMFGVPDSQSFTEAMPFILDSIRKRDMGFFHPTYGGETLRIMKLAGKLVMYGTNGVCVATPVESEDGMSHVVEKIADVGLGDKNALVAVDGAHVFIDGSGRWWVINSNFQLQPLRYENVTEGEGGMISNRGTNAIQMSFDLGNQDVYVSNGLKSYVRSRTGVSEHKIAVTSIANMNGEAYAYWKVLDTSAVVSLRTQTIDFGERMLKSIHDVEVGRYDVSNLWMRIWYRTSGSVGWRMSDWVLCVDGGFAVPLIEGHDIQLEFKYEPGENARFEYAKINWLRRDLRNFRVHQSRII